MNANEYIDKLRDEFIEAQTKECEWEYLIGINNVEQRDIRGYHGREILELLQNADDAYQKAINSNKKPECELEISISYLGNVLTISNTGTFFDKEGIRAIVQGNNSPKREGYIGNKGTGFRSILNWAESVSIDSGDFHIIFSEKIAREVFDEIKKSSQIQKQLEKKPELYVPMLAVPVNKDDFKSDDKTTISITVNPDKTKDEYGVEKQLDEIDLRILLFLPNINKIHIQTDGKVVEYERVKDEESHEVVLEKKVNGIFEKKELFLLFKKDIPNFVKDKEQSKNLGMVIAIPDSTENVESSYLYSFFPVFESTSPFKCLFHATYELGDQRNNLLTNEVNYNIIKEQLIFLFSDVADYLVKRKNFKKLYEIITPISTGMSFLFQKPFSSFNSYGIESFYLDLLGKAKIFKTVCDGILSLDENPRLIEGFFPESFKGPGFENLLDTIDSSDIVKLIKRYIDVKKLNFSYSETELLEVINKHSDSWDVHQQVETFIWWNEKKYKSLPKLLKNGNDDWLKYQDVCYFLVGSFKEDFVPSWASIPTLKLSYQEELLSQSESLPIIRNVKDSQDGQQTPRIISQQRIFSSLTFRYLDRSTVISPVNSSVTNYETAIKFVQWLWDNYNEENWHPQDEIKFKFPAIMKDGKTVVLSAQEIYFGSEYDNSLSELLFDDSYGRFPSQSEWEINDESFIDFVAKFGVKKFPVIQKMEVEKKDILSSYDSFYKEQVKKQGDLGASTSFSLKYKFPYIKSLKEIFDNLDTKSILKWIAKDKDLYACISNPLYNNTDVVIKYRGNLQHDERTLNRDIPKKNYILALFNETAWIQKNEKRYSPKQMLKGVNSKINRDFSELLPVIDLDFISAIAQQIELTNDVVSDIFNKFDFCNNPTELSSEQFYELMLRIPQLPLNKAEKLSRYIYRIIEQPDFNKTFENSRNCKLFKEGGKLLVKHEGVVKFYPACQSYLPSSKIVNKREIPIVEKNQRSGNNHNFKQLFGCRVYDKSYVIDEVSLHTVVDDIFQEYFSDFKKYAQAFSSRNRNIAEVGPKLNIQLINNIQISINEVKSSIEEEYVPIRKTESNWYITCFSDDLDFKELSLAIESIYENIANTNQFDAGKIGELFREKDQDNRKFLIKKEFGSLDIIDDSNYVLAELYGRNLDKEKVVQKLKEKFPNKDIVNESNGILDELDYNHLTHESQDAKIHKLLKKLDITVADFNSCISVSVSLARWNQAILKNEFKRVQESITMVLWNLAKESADKRTSFLMNVQKVISDFSNFNDCHEYEDVDLNASNIIQEFLKDRQITIPPAEQIENIRTQKNEIFNKNKGFLTQKIKDLGHDFVDFKHVISNDAVKQAAYFNKPDELMSAFDAYVKSLPNTQTGPQNPGNGPGGARSIKAPTPPPPGGGRGGPTGGNAGGGRGGPRGGNAGGGPGVILGGGDNGKLTRGGDVEKFIVRMLKKRAITEVNEFFGEDDYDVFWVSSYAIDCGESVTANDGAGYDIEVISKADPSKVLYIESKSSVGEHVSFYISVGNELAWAKQHPDNYLILFVPNSAKISLETEKDEHDYIAIWYRDLDREYKPITDKVKYVKR